MPRAPAISAPARRTIKSAFEELDRAIGPGDSRKFGQLTLQDVKNEALDIENQLAARQSLRYMRRLMPLFNGLEHYSKVIDILCNGTPYLPWIWAPITLVLRLASEYVDAFEQIIKGYARIASSLGRFELLSAAFITDSNFQQTLAVFYADILQFHKHAYKFVSRSGWRLLFLTSWGRFQRRFDNILDDLKHHGDLIDTESNARNISEAQRMRQDIRTWREESRAQVYKFEEEQTARQHEFIASWLNVNESDQLAIFDSISAEGVEHPGTCEWILRNSKVRSWCQRKPDTAILWLQGTPGSGKSVLSTQLVNFMKTGKQFVIRHFCSYLYATSTAYEQILKSMLIQLLRKDDDLVAHVYEQYVVGKKSPSCGVLEQLLQTLLKSMSTEPSQAEFIWIVIDGLDECESKNQTRLVNLINHITKTSVPGGVTCKVLISSRVSSTSLSRLRKRQVLSLAEEKDSMQGAIQQYIHQRLQSLHEGFSQLGMGQPEFDEIQDKIAGKTDGMFLYARLVLDYLSHNIFYTYGEIKDSLNQLPEELTDFYRKILTQMLVQLDSRSVDHVKNILGWVAFARRPLRKLEFLSALSYSSGNPDVTNLTPRFLQTPSSNVVIHEQEALQEHAVAIIACLLSGARVFNKAYPEQAKYQRVAKGLHGLHVYATEYWTECLLSHAASVHELDKAYGQPGAPNAGSNIRVSDKRLELLQQHALLHRHVEGALKGRSLKRLESELLQVPHTVPDKNSQQLPNSPFIEPISAMLISYQDVVRALLSKHTYPGVSAEELELFKTHFRTSAFTCRLNSCFRATLGFESAKKCLEHEMSHVQCLRCTFPGCQYPPFGSAQALRSHANKYHNPNPPRKAIRGPRAVDDSVDPTHAQRLLKGQDGRLYGTPFFDRSLLPNNTQQIPHFQLPPEKLDAPSVDMQSVPSPTSFIQRPPDQANFSATVSNRPITSLPPFDYFIGLDGSQILTKIKSMIPNIKNDYIYRNQDFLKSESLQGIHHHH
ncbi:hypothetical protein BGZ61DRAFT_502084 [Ilyonectria robusta]|uniref:uncharacterized protein n=1 Tax=Ilyonectria robusta TaxID=1079257 RepID=UPI001E8DB6DF|nr:uncharacterized protein BGZ61DRAFT_502084 [Ilyonectria robusta]KAH8738106.1 hypothetical protein BGZ61DRAFT_502084 [Ilyonectria robusta]